jgi:hypothetical protein
VTFRSLWVEVIETAVNVFPRVFVHYVLEPFMNEFISSLRDPGSEFLLKEAKENVLRREKTLRQQHALQEVRKELTKYNVEAPVEAPPPDDFFCPVSLDLMVDPVTAADGYTYERASIERWIRDKRGNDGKVKSPMSGIKMVLEPLHSNFSLKSRISQFESSKPARLSSRA